MLEISSYLAYLGISLAVTVWVGRTLFSNGRIFLLDAFAGNAQMADSVNQLLRVGFYLLNFGFIALFLNTGRIPETVGGLVKQLSWQVGVVLLVLGTIHLFNMKNIAGMRSRALHKLKPKVDEAAAAPASRWPEDASQPTV
ncbi:hypothetical protein [Deinococcus arenicola]|uniref:Integral membrane protein n=1 Tax=Deinococcus arenicola TaxID=2994950 RepID=A0ABU4DTL5_9DEIO|nr:hypothetical protein [Deinococcus sp. ZS9-10]MDV6375788.1 hypothetical protein [Deinococcus sp. ZS9-10]